MLLALVPLALAMSASPALVISDTALCPTGSAIDEQLRARGLADDGSAAPPINAQLYPLGDRVHLKLLAQDGHTLAERDLPPGSCDDLARAAATLLAAWRTEFHLVEPRFALRSPSTVSPIEFDVGAALSASMAGTTFAPDGTIAAVIGRHGGRVLGRAAITAGGLRSLSVGDGSGHARFLRAGLSLGPDIRFRPGRWLFDLFAEATVAVAYVDAVGFLHNFSATAVDLSLGGGLRAGVRLGHVLPFFQVRVAGWLTGQSVTVTGADGGSSNVPPFELFLELGVAFGRF